MPRVRLSTGALVAVAICAAADAAGNAAQCSNPRECRPAKCCDVNAKCVPKAAAADCRWSFCSWFGLGAKCTCEDGRCENARAVAKAECKADSDCATKRCCTDKVGCVPKDQAPDCSTLKCMEPRRGCICSNAGKCQRAPWWWILFPKPPATPKPRKCKSDGDCQTNRCCGATGCEVRPHDGPRVCQMLGCLKKPKIDGCKCGADGQCTATLRSSTPAPVSHWPTTCSADYHCNPKNCCGADNYCVRLPPRPCPSATANCPQPRCGCVGGQCVTTAPPQTNSPMPSLSPEPVTACASDAQCSPSACCGAETCGFHGPLPCAPPATDAPCPRPKCSCSDGQCLAVAASSGPCESPVDCVPDHCCHPTKCVPRSVGPKNCRFLRCRPTNPVSCGCAKGKCTATVSTPAPVPMGKCTKDSDCFSDGCCRGKCVSAPAPVCTTTKPCLRPVPSCRCSAKGYCEASHITPAKCESPKDCVPDHCCHPTKCVPRSVGPKNCHLVKCLQTSKVSCGCAKGKCTAKVSSPACQSTGVAPCLPDACCGASTCSVHPPFPCPRPQPGVPCPQPTCSCEGGQCHATPAPRQCKSPKDCVPNSCCAPTACVPSGEGPQNCHLVRCAHVTPMTCSCENGSCHSQSLAPLPHASCTSKARTCVPNACCHATKCVPEAEGPGDCSGVPCTKICMPGTLDCGGKCLCGSDGCGAQLYQSPSHSPAPRLCKSEKDCPKGQECDTKTGVCRNPAAECRADSDCVGGTCCHPDTCVPVGSRPNCAAVPCTLECRDGTLDCGLARCACRGGQCAFELSQK